MSALRALPRLTFLLLIVVGCGGHKISAVKGVVTLDGHPLACATVVFISLDPDGRDANGFTDEEGKFELSTIIPKEGVLAGNYKIVIQICSRPGSAPSGLESRGGSNGGSAAINGA